MGTFFLIKSDVLRRDMVGQVLARIEAAGFRLTHFRRVYADTGRVEEHYRDHRGKSHFNALVESMASRYVVAGNAIHRSRPYESVALFRELIGPYDPLVPGTIRGDFAIDSRENSIHGADSEESAQRETALWRLP